MSQSLGFYICTLVLGSVLTYNISLKYNCKTYNTNFLEFVDYKTDQIKDYCIYAKLSTQCFTNADIFKEEQMQNLKNDLKELGCKNEI